ncbi:hypothetical protein ES288_A04G144400v1 [Gossypium darwinii]|uniref:Uncharacterized protein n=1 Tax=Gossypium darwinii TaxID=34276 RepID=A0A5D2GY22_GOSDA|nr:hypothetical protein ES288_A04G144400v1 [Gossypium darwinii]
MGGAAGAPVAMDVSRANLGPAHLGFSFFFWVENVVGLIGLGFVIGLISFGFLIWALLTCKWTVNNIWTFTYFCFYFVFWFFFGPGKKWPITYVFQLCIIFCDVLIRIFSSYKVSYRPCVSIIH